MLYLYLSAHMTGAFFPVLFWGGRAFFMVEVKQKLSMPEA
jgi:hypothetical protein